MPVVAAAVRDHADGACAVHACTRKEYCVPAKRPITLWVVALAAAAVAACYLPCGDRYSTRKPVSLVLSSAQARFTCVADTAVATRLPGRSGAAEPNLADAYLALEEYNRARLALEELLAVVERAGMRFVVGAAHRRLGEAALATGEDAGAAAGVSCVYGRSGGPPSRRSSSSRTAAGRGPARRRRASSFACRSVSARGRSAPKEI